MLFKSNVDVQFTVNSSQVSPEIWNHIDQSLSRDADWYLVSCVEEVTIEGDRSFSTYTITFQPPETALVGDMVAEIALLESMGAEFGGLLLSVPPTQAGPARDAESEQSDIEQIRALINQRLSDEWLEYPYSFK
jgi:hypothetical protein